MIACISLWGATPNGEDAEIIEIILNPVVLTEVKCILQSMLNARSYYTDTSMQAK